VAVGPACLFPPFQLESCLAEDKIVQKVVVNLLNAIYEQDFLGYSYGFRPGRGQHQALDKVGQVICTRPTGWVLEIVAGK
jgi:retron-type reverse transcriptase